MPRAKVGWYHAWTVAERIAERNGVIRARDFAAYEVPHQWLQVLSGLELQQIGPGLYVPHGARVDGRVVLAKKYPNLTLGLTSALWVRGVLSERPEYQWWVLGSRDRLPSLRKPHMRFARSSWPQEDREELELDGTTIPCQSVVRALLDCVRFRGRLGPGVAARALQRALETEAVSAEALRHRAEELHVHAPLRRLLRQLAVREPEGRREVEASAH